MARVVECLFGAYLLLCILQTYLAGAQECRTCYRSVPYQTNRRASRTSSYTTTCFIFFRCTNSRTVYYTEAYTAYRTVSYCCRGTGSIANEALRLEGGSSESSGRLEVHYSGQWGTVCDDAFDSNDGEVACMQLGFAGQRTVTRELGGGSGRIWLDNVQCTGTETWLANCSSNDWGVHNCNHREDVGVTCNSALQIRLVGGGSNPFSGRVEYYLQGIWATVCDDYFGTADGDVVCNQLGFGNATDVRHFSSGSGSIAFDDLDCSGDEISLLFCPHDGAFSHNCAHNEDAGVVCEGPKPSITSIRASSSDLSITLAWQLPWQLKYQTIIRGYRVQYGTSNNTFALQSKDLTTTATNDTTTISGLAASTTYYFRVAMQTSASNIGPYSDFVTADTRAGDPQALTSLVTSPSSATSIRVTWIYSASRSTLTSSGGYLIKYSAVSPQGISDAGDVRVSRYTSSYTIGGLEEGVQYKITVNAYVGTRNGVSRTSYATTYTRAPTGPPQSVTASPSSSLSVRVTWSPPQLHLQNGRLTGYKITCSSLQGSLVSVMTSSSSSSATVTGLSPYTQYTCKVAARNQNGDGPYSRAVVVVTAEAVPSGAPVSVRAVTIGSTTIHLQWSPPPANTINGVPLDYVISYGLASNGGSQNRISTGDTRTRYEFTNLEPYTGYSFQVAVRNSIGMGPYSGSVSTVTATDVPRGPPQSVSVASDSSFSIRVAWSPPPVDQQRGQIIAYSVVYGVSPTLDSTQSIRAVGSSVFVTSLAPYTQYYVKVAAATVNGTGPYSSIYTATTYAYAPSGSPNIVSFTTDESVALLTLSWTPPEESALNGPLSGISYRVRYGKLGEVATEVAVNSSQTSGSSVQQYTMRNLEYGTTYFAQVAAESSNGTGPYSNTITQHTVTINAKNPPRNVLVTATGAYSVRVTWSTPADDGNTEPITGYRVIYGKINGGTSSSTTTTGLSVDLGQLAPFTNYFVRVAALRMQAVGVYSNDVFVQTGTAAPTGSPRDISFQVSARQVSLTWKPPAQGEANGPVTGFEILLVRDELERRKRSVDKRAANGQTVFTVGGHLTAFTIADLEPYVDYCVQMAAVNANGTGPLSNASCFETLQDVPGPVASVTVATVSSTELSVSWAPPTSPNGVIIGYTLAYTSDPNTNIYHDGELVSITTSEVLSDLHEGVQYQLGVKAITAVGIGPEVMSTGTTYTAAPSAPPSAVQLDPQSAYSISVNWTLPPLVDRNGPITGYVLRYQQADEGPETSTDVAVGLAQLYLLENLQPYTDYSVQVAAVNVNGTGPFSTFQEIKTFSAIPGPPENLTALNTSTQQIRVIWDPPISPNGILQGYKLTYKATAPPGVPDTVNTRNVTETAVELEGLLKGVTYGITVAALNEVGEGDTVTTQQATTPAAPEAPPLDFSIINVTERSVILTWAPPTATLRNGPLEQYIVTYGIEGDTIETTQKLKAKEMNILEHEVVIHTIERLTPFTRYFFIVAFVNPAGRSGFTNKLVTRTLPAVPSSVRNLTDVRVAGSYVVIQWLPPETTYGNIVNYKIYVDGEEVQTVPYSLLAYNVTNLTCGATYSIGVTAGNSRGHSRVNQIRIRPSRRVPVGEAVGTVDDNSPMCGPDTIAVTTDSSISGLQAAQYGVIGAIIVIVVVVIISITLCCICCARRYKKMKAIAASHTAEVPSVEYSIDPLYDEIPYDKNPMDMAASGDAKRLEADSEYSKYENPYTFGPIGANLELNGTSAIAHDPDGSIGEEDMYVEGIAPDAVHVSSSGTQVYYNASPAKGDQPTSVMPTEFPYDVPKNSQRVNGGQVFASASPAKGDQPAPVMPSEFPYDVPKNNQEAPQQDVAKELGAQLLDTEDCDYESIHTSDTLEAHPAASNGTAMES